MYKLLFFCPAQHHVNHVMPLLECLIKVRSVKIFVVTKVSFDLEGVKRYARLSLIPPRFYDAFISTELVNPPFWVKTKMVFLGHGVGPKMGYQSHPNVKFFQYSLTPCAPIMNAHHRMGINVIKSGLPILDSYISDSVKSDDLLTKLGLDGCKKTINYIPSWSNDINLMQNIIPTINSLAKLKSFNVVISPHPNLLKLDKCGNINFFKNLPINIFLNKTHSTLDVSYLSDFIVGDISSSFFEAMAIGKLAVWDGDIQNYSRNNADFLLPEIQRICLRISDIEDSKNIDYQYYRGVQKKFIESYIYNLGKATEKILVELAKVICKKESFE